LKRSKASILARLGRSDDAEALFREATGLSRGLGMRRLECEIAGEFGRVLSRSGRVDEANALMTRVSEGWPEGDAAARAVAERRLRAAGWSSA